MVKKYNKPLFNIFIDFINLLSGLVLAILVLLVFCQVTSRYVFNYSFPWAEELPILFFAWASFLGAVSALQKNEHLNIEFFYKIFPIKVQKGIKIVASLFTAVLIIVLIIVGGEFAYSLGSASFVVLPIPKSLFYLSLVVGSILMIPVLGRHIINIFKDGGQ